MKRYIFVLLGICVVGCIGSASASTNEPVADGLVQSAYYLIMEKKEESPEPEWMVVQNIRDMPTVQAAYVPVDGIPIDMEKAQQNSEIITMLSEDIQGALQQYNPGVWYSMDSAYADVITESMDCPGLYRIVINVNTSDSIERLVFDVSADTQAELVRYSRMRV